MRSWSSRVSPSLKQDTAAVSLREQQSLQQPIPKMEGQMLPLMLLSLMLLLWMQQQTPNNSVPPVARQALGFRV